MLRYASQKPLMLGVTMDTIAKARVSGSSNDSLVDPEGEMTLDHVSGNPEAAVNRSRKRLKRPTIVILIDTPLNE